jgi:hypothetical protein
MSLTSFIDEPDVKAWFKANFPFRAPKFQPLACSEPRTKRFTLIGTAFDYLLRFKLQQTCPYAVVKPWVAEYLAGQVEIAVGLAEEAEYEEGMLLGLDLDIDTIKSVWQAMKQARANHASYLASGVLTDDLLRSAIHLAQMDSWFRAGVLGIPFGEVDEEDVKDLRNLWNIIPMGLLSAEKVCLLNPVFGSSALVGGADVDIVLDDVLIDIKTTKFLKVSRDYINQLLGYYILHRIGGLVGAPHGHQINTIGIYFSRHGYLHTWPITDFVNEITYPDLQQWFENRANKRGS